MGFVESEKEFVLKQQEYQKRSEAYLLKVQKEQAQLEKSKKRIPY